MRHHSLRKLQQTFEPVHADRVLECPTVLQVTKRFILYCDPVSRRLRARKKVGVKEGTVLAVKGSEPRG